MSVSPSVNPASSRAASGPSAALVVLLAAGAGLSVASLYYSQPVLGVLAADLHVSERMIGLVPMLTQLGYALGILLLAPLGDRYDRRRILLLKVAALPVALLVSGFAPSIGWLLAGSLAIGAAATLAQDIIPAAATLAPEAHRGKVVGTVMTGLLLGILLSRVVSGVVAAGYGWRAVYVAAAAAVAVIGAITWRGLPAFRPTTQLSYRALLGSMRALWRRHAELRRAAGAQALLSIGFGAFWSTLAVMLHGRFHLGSAAAGAFGLAGAAGALAAPLAGRLADRRGPGLVTQLGTALATVSFAALGLAVVLPPQLQLALLVVTAIGFDFGVQATLVAHQTIVFGIEPAARSRLNAILITGLFIGMATGAGLGSLALDRWGWAGIVALATATSAGALAVRLRRSGRVPAAIAAGRPGPR